MKRLLALAIFLSIALLQARAQSPAPAARLSSIAGTVIKQPGSEPLKKVLVQVIAENQKEGGNYTASTDADGHFHIDDRLPGDNAFVEAAIERSLYGCFQGDDRIVAGNDRAELVRLAEKLLLFFD